MLMALLSAVILQVGMEPKPVVAPSWEAAHPALMAKAPGAPGYGVQFTTTSGKLVFTNLHFNPTTLQPGAELYRIRGNAGNGPYRAGFELGFMPKQPVTGDALHPCWFDAFYYIDSVQEGSPAQIAGLERGKYTPHPQRVIEGIDGKNFGWNLGNLIWYLTNSPVVELNMLKRPIIGGPSRWNTKLTLRKLETPPDPADGTLEPGGAEAGTIGPWLEAQQMWKDLLVFRSRMPRMAPLPIDLPSGRRWVVTAPLNPGEPKEIRGLEVWKEDPLMAPYPYTRALTDLWPEPLEGFEVGRVLRIENQWYRIQALASDPSTHRLITFELRPWEAGILPLLGGQTLVRELGTLQTAQPREALEQLGNRALLEWKTRTLPDQLAGQNRGSAEDLVLRIEQGLLDLDLEVKGIRSRLDAAARAEAERKAQAELAAKNGQPAPPAQAAPATESERLADLLEQRKAILMAILGSAKQALSTLRR